MKEAVSKVIVVGTVQKVHCSRRRFLRRGLEFHVCSINKSAHMKKSGNSSYAPRNKVETVFPDVMRKSSSDVLVMVIQFTIELFICIKMDLALNNQKWLMCHKTKPKSSLTKSKVPRLPYYLPKTVVGEK